MKKRSRATAIPRALATLALLTGLLVVLLAGPAVASDLVRMNGDVEVGPGERYDSVVVMNGDILVMGYVDGDVFAANGDIEVADGGYVGGDAVSLTGDVRTTGTGTIAGNSAEGDFNFQPGDIPNVVVGPGDIGAGGLGWLFLTLGAVGFGLLLVLVSATTLHAVGGEVSHHMGRSALIGVISLIGVPALFVVLCITIIGIPLALLMIPLVPLVSLYGLYAVSLVAGQRLLKLFNQPNAGDLWAMVAGVVLVGLVLLIPVLGWLLLFVASLVGFGAALSRLWEYIRLRRKARPAPSETPPHYPAPPYPVTYSAPTYPPAGPVAPYSDTYPAAAASPAPATYPAPPAPPTYATPPYGAEPYAPTPGETHGYPQQQPLPSYPTYPVADTIERAPEVVAPAGETIPPAPTPPVAETPPPAEVEAAFGPEPAAPAAADVDSEAVGETETAADAEEGGPRFHI